jgi:simple sugar transport system permease protein
MGVESLITLEFLITSLAITVRIAPTILFASLGEVIAEKSGVVNLGTEGVMLITAFTAFYVSFQTGQPIIGLLTAMSVGVVLGLVHTLLTIYLGLNQVVVGLGVWLFGFGLPDILYRILFREVSSPVVNVLPEAPIPLLSDIPVLGPILFRHNILVYVALLSIPLTWFLLNHTKLGLRIVAAGENPKAAHSAGVNVLRTRMVAVVLGSLLASLSGAYFTVAFLRSYITNITFGRGFIAVAMVYFGNWSPVRLLIPLLLYNFVDSIQTILQTADIGVRYYVLNMLPFLTIIALMPFFARRARPPTALMKPFR